MNKAEIIAFMNANPTCYLATVDGDAPRVRAMGIYKVTEDEIIIQTNVTKDVNKQMLQNPNIEAASHNWWKFDLAISYSLLSSKSILLSNQCFL